MAVHPSRGGRSVVFARGAALATFCSLLLLTTALEMDPDGDHHEDATGAARSGGRVDVGAYDAAAGGAWGPRRALTSQYTGPRDTQPIAHQGASGRRTIISQANHGALAVEFKTVLTFSLPLVRAPRALGGRRYSREGDHWEREE